MKNPVTAALLGFFFGPLGLLYVKPLYALIGIVACVAIYYGGGMPFVAMTGIPFAIAGYVLAKQDDDATIMPQNRPNNRN